MHDSTAAAIDPSSVEWTPRNFRYNHRGLCKFNYPAHFLDLAPVTIIGFEICNLIVVISTIQMMTCSSLRLKPG